LAEMLMDGLGSANLAIVDNTHRLWTAGSITSMPTISVTAVADPATTKIGDVGLGSASLVGAYDYADNVQPLRIELGSYLLIAGSISTMPTITTTTQLANIDTGSRGALVSGANTLLIEHMITAGSYYNLTGFDSTGTADGKFSLLENDKLVAQYRSSASTQVITKDFTNPISFTSGGSVMIFVEHGELLSQGFQGAMYGYESE